MKTDSFKLLFLNNGNGAKIILNNGKIVPVSSACGLLVRIGELVRDKEITLSQAEFKQLIIEAEIAKKDKALALFTQDREVHESIFMKKEFMDIMTIHWFPEEIKLLGLENIHLLEEMRKPLN